MAQKTKLKIDLLVVLGMVLAAIPIIIYFQVNFLTSIILFFVVPSIYLLIRKTKSLKRILAASFLFGVILGFIFDFLAELNNAWAWPNIEQLVFPYKILGLVPIDVMAWYFFWIFSILVFYEHFFENDQSDSISPNFKYGFYLAVIALLIVIILFFIAPDILNFNYAYLLFGLITLLPFLFFILRKPFLLFKFLKVSLFFIFLYLAFELTSLKLGHWYFPGQYIGSVELLGLRFPFEEFFFWIFMSSAVVLSYYEYLIDDGK